MQDIQNQIENLATDLIGSRDNHFGFSKHCLWGEKDLSCAGEKDDKTNGEKKENNT